MALNEGLFVFFGEGVVKGACCVSGGGVEVRRVWCSCLVVRVAFLGDFAVEDCFAS